MCGVHHGDNSGSAGNATAARSLSERPDRSGTVHNSATTSWKNTPNVHCRHACSKVESPFTEDGGVLLGAIGAGMSNICGSRVVPDLLDVFSDIARRNPGRPAIVHRGRALGYGRRPESANALATRPGHTPVPGSPHGRRADGPRAGNGGRTSLRAGRRGHRLPRRSGIPGGPPTGQGGGPVPYRGVRKVRRHTPTRRPIAGVTGPDRIPWESPGKPPRGRPRAARNNRPAFPSRALPHVENPPPGTPRPGDRHE